MISSAVKYCIQKQTHSLFLLLILKERINYKKRVRWAPGVVVAVPLLQRRVLAEGCVVPPQDAPRVVGHGVQAVHSVPCRGNKNPVCRTQRQPALNFNLSVLLNLSFLLTAVCRGKLAQVQLCEGEVDEGGELFGVWRGLGETLQVWGELVKVKRREYLILMQPLKQCTNKHTQN